MKLVILILIVLQTTAYAVENAPGDFLRFRFSALTQVSQMRIITKPRINFDGDIPTAWEGDSCVDDTENVWLPYPMNDNSLCCRNEDLDGFMLWPEQEEVLVEADTIKVDWLNGDWFDGQCVVNTTNDQLLKYLPAGDSYNSYMAQVNRAATNSGYTDTVTVNYLMEFHNQDIVALIYTNGRYCPQGYTAYLNSAETLTKHLYDSDATFDLRTSSSSRPYLSVEGKMYRGSGLNDARFSEYELYEYNCDTRPICTSAPTSGPTSEPTSGPTSAPTDTSGRGEGGGDPHITTWHNEHYEYHGQCDLLMLEDAHFADGLGLHIHIRTKIVRYWSYIKTVAIKIGNDILEVEGSADSEDAEAHYWFNYEYQGDLDSIAGFPVSQKLPSVYKRQYNIDLSSKYPGKEIVVQIFKEFVRVKFNGNEQVFGSSVGLLGDYTTGKTLARDGITVMNDFTELGDEWQLLPSDPKLFHEVAHPQFPETCIKPEDPRGDRMRRLSESHISVEQAEAACGSLKDPLAMKDCVYDVLATQDLDMVGAF
ncbi:MAG: hypothetical protein SGBAC_009999 [Bacillariaceae sp.]